MWHISESARLGWISGVVMKICVSGEVEAEGSKVQSQQLPFNNDNDKNKMKDPSLTPQSIQKLCPSAKLQLLILESLGEPWHYIPAVPTTPDRFPQGLQDPVWYLLPVIFI